MRCDEDAGDSSSEAHRESRVSCGDPTWGLLPSRSIAKSLMKSMKQCRTPRGRKGPGVAACKLHTRSNVTLFWMAQPATCSFLLSTSPSRTRSNTRQARKNVNRTFHPAPQARQQVNALIRSEALFSTSIFLELTNRSRQRKQDVVGRVTKEKRISSQLLALDYLMSTLQTLVREETAAPKPPWTQAFQLFGTERRRIAPCLCVGGSWQRGIQAMPVRGRLGRMQSKGRVGSRSCLWPVHEYPNRCSAKPTRTLPSGREKGESNAKNQI